MLVRKDFFFFFKQKTAYEISLCLVGSEMCIRGWSKVRPLTIDPAKVALHADIAPALGGAADWSQITTIDLEQLPEEFRQQRLVFKAAQKAFEQLQEQFKGQREYLLFQLVRLVETFLASDKIDIPSLFHQDPLRKRILFSMHMEAIVQHLMA